MQYEMKENKKKEFEEEMEIKKSLEFGEKM